MIIKEKAIYLCSFKKEFSKNIQKEDSFGGHGLGKWNSKTIVWPKSIDSETINPKNFIKLKKELNLKEIIIVDQLKGTKEIVSIGNHINRSGQNFLRGVTPEGKHPQFPDMSKIYHKISGLDTEVVHTLGEKRFKNPPSDEERTVWSEYVGLIAPVAHYVGIKVFAIGENNLDIIKQFIRNI